jgi:hypothetical protein
MPVISFLVGSTGLLTFLAHPLDLSGYIAIGACLALMVGAVVRIALYVRAVRRGDRD